MLRLIIIGAGGHGKVVAECAEKLNRYSEIAFLEARKDVKACRHWPVHNQPESFTQYVDEHTEFFVAIGNNEIRQKLQQELLCQSAKLATLVHPQANVSEYVTLGKGTLVLAKAAINIDAQIGQGCIVNTGATIDHDCVIGDFVHTAPGVNLAGNVTLSDRVFIGIGASVIQGMHVGQDAVVGAGATVVSNISEATTVVGTPARPLQQQTRGNDYA